MKCALESKINVLSQIYNFKITQISLLFSGSIVYYFVFNQTKPTLKSSFMKA